jgi:glutathione S-transferase
MLELYHSPFSTCSQKVHLCLAEKGLAYVDRIISFSAQDHLTDAYLAINPNGVVPTLIDDGMPIIDSSVICEYIDEIAPEPALMPSSALGRGRVRAWMRYLEEVPTKAIRVPSFNGLFSDHLQQMGQDNFENLADQLPLRKHFYLKMQNGRFSDAELQESFEGLIQTITRAELSLSKGTWLVGEQFTIADILLIPTMVRMEDMGFAHLWVDSPKVTSWYSRVRQRPSFGTAFSEGSRITPELFSLDQEVSSNLPVGN